MFINQIKEIEIENSEFVSHSTEEKGGAIYLSNS